MHPGRRQGTSSPTARHVPPAHCSVTGGMDGVHSHPRETSERAKQIERKPQSAKLCAVPLPGRHRAQKALLDPSRLGHLQSATHESTVEAPKDENKCSAVEHSPHRAKCKRTVRRHVEQNARTERYFLRGPRTSQILCPKRMSSTVNFISGAQI